MPGFIFIKVAPDASARVNVDTIVRYQADPNGVVIDLIGGFRMFSRMPIEKVDDLISHVNNEILGHTKEYSE